MVWGRNYFGELVMSTIRRLRLKMLEDNAESHVHHRGVIHTSGVLARLRRCPGPAERADIRTSVLAGSQKPWRKV